MLNLNGIDVVEVPYISKEANRIVVVVRKINVLDAIGTSLVP